MGEMPKLREWSEKDIRAFVKDLESLRCGELAASALVGCGERAIAPLRDFLLYGTPRTIFQPRQLAVEALDELGASEVLLEYLETPRSISDPAVRFAESAVESNAARALGRWRTERVYDVLTRFAESHVLPGLVESLGLFERKELVGYFLRALEDDTCRNVAEDALRRLGGEARKALVEGALCAKPSRANEIPSSRLRRRSCLRLLQQMILGRRDWTRLQPLLKDVDPEISLCAAEMALVLGDESDRKRAVRVLIAGLELREWLLRLEARDWLLKYFGECEQAIRKEISVRSAKPEPEQRRDRALRSLLWVESRGRDTTQEEMVAGNV